MLIEMGRWDKWGIKYLNWFAFGGVMKRAIFCIAVLALSAGIAHAAILNVDLNGARCERRFNLCGERRTAR